MGLGRSSHPLARVFFDIISSTRSENGPRLGNLSFLERTAFGTPNYVAVSSRGAIPHISQDNMRDHMSVNGVYTALEDCESCLRNQHFLSLLDFMLMKTLVLAPTSYRKSTFGGSSRV